MEANADQPVSVGNLKAVLDQLLYGGGVSR